MYKESRDNLVGIATDYRLNDRGSISSIQRLARIWGPQSPVQWIPWTLSLGIKGQGHEADHSQSMVELYLHSHIYLHGIVFN
jgi:hypothetical protein